MKHKKIVLTGGGTSGHVTPNIALIKRLKQDLWQCFYIGSNTGIEKKITTAKNIKFYGIASGKLRRYFSWQNFIDPFKILFGILQAFILLLRLKPNIVFSKGGFVAFPVVFAAWLLRIPVIAHESDLTPGLATKLSVPFARYICLTFAKAKEYFKSSAKLKVTGTPIRESLLTGDSSKGQDLCGFSVSKPNLMIIGGGSGAMAINKVIHQSLDELLKNFNIVHLCGLGKVDTSIIKNGYKQFDYVTDEMPHLFAMADLILSRSGANSVYEILALAKPHIFIPLPLSASRGDQIHNANYFKKLGISLVIDESQLTKNSLLQAITEISATKEQRIKKIQNLNITSGTENIVKLISDVALNSI